MRTEQIRLRGRVQGVGMRPALYRLAADCGLRGQIRNDGAGVEMRLCGESSQLDTLIRLLPQRLPPLARLDELQRELIANPGPAPTALRIDPSDAHGHGAVVLPDAATCPDCLAEIRDPAARRHAYAFTNCSHCGPRLSIQQGIPWDRERTAMADFPLCRDCAAEYGDPDDRRYHAQPLACPACGPRCALRDPAGQLLAQGEAVIDHAATLLQAGRIIAIKGLGGFHLACDATDAGVVQLLRRRKLRPAKPLAVMARDFEQLADLVDLDAQARDLLSGPTAPIVLLPRTALCALPAALAPGLDRLGVMLPATPLHHLLLQAMDRPLVMTSGNRAGAPPCVDNQQARSQLADIADVFLEHDRPIVNRLDDSVMQVVDGQPQVLRLARGLAPAQQGHGVAGVPRVLALGAELKASFALLREQDWILGQHVGDLEQVDNLRDFEAALGRYQRLYDFEPDAIAVDAHPAYLSHQLGRRLASQRELPLIEVQHHHAHAVSVLAEHGRQPDQGPWLAICCDGLGLGENRELWGGELLLVDFAFSRRLGRWRPAALIGGDAASREPWRNLYAVLDQLGGRDWFRSHHPRLAARLDWPQPPEQLDKLLRGGRHAPACSSVGRSFDALAWLLQLCPERISYEAEAAARLQALAGAEPGGRYRIDLRCDDGFWELDWRALWRAILADAERGLEPAVIAAEFHAAVAAAWAQLAARLAPQHSPHAEVVLNGGVFQNARLLSLSRRALSQHGLQALTARSVPGNDGGIALGQAWVAAVRLGHHAWAPQQEVSTCA